MRTRRREAGGGALSEARMASSGSPPRYPWWLGLAARVGILFLDLLIPTLRWRVGAGGEHLDRVAASERPVIFAFWHNRLVVCGEWIQRHLISARRPVALLTSLSRDGELAARMSGIRGYRSIRGSSSRGGLASLRAMQRAVRSGASVATAPDGPRGPSQVAQPGAVMLAKLTGAPIVPVAYAASRTWRLRSWDRLVVPRPFSRVVVTAGEPMEVPRKLSHEELAAVTAELERRLNELVARARELV